MEDPGAAGQDGNCNGGNSFMAKLRKLSVASNNKTETPDTPDKDGGNGLDASIKKPRKFSILSNKTSTNTADDEPKTNAFALLRRRSTFKGIATGLLGLRRLKGRMSIGSGLEDTKDTKPKVRLENTYKIDPDEGKEFRAKQVEKVVTDILEKELSIEKYDKERCKNITCDLTVLIKNKIKSLGFTRYKIICNVVIGQCSDQGVAMASQSIWNPTTDNYACASYKNSSLFAVALVHAAYYE